MKKAIASRGRLFPCRTYIRFTQENRSHSLYSKYEVFSCKSLETCINFGKAEEGRSGNLLPKRVAISTEELFMTWISRTPEALLVDSNPEPSKVRGFKKCDAEESLGGDRNDVKVTTDIPANRRKGKCKKNMSDNVPGKARKPVWPEQRETEHGMDKGWKVVGNEPRSRHLTWQ